MEELDSIEAGQLAAIVGRQQPPLSEGGSVRHPPLARLRALARASATVIGLLDSPDKVGVLLIALYRANAQVRHRCIVLYLVEIVYARPSKCGLCQKSVHATVIYSTDHV